MPSHIKPRSPGKSLTEQVIDKGLEMIGFPTESRQSQSAPSEPIGGDELHGQFSGALGEANRPAKQAPKKKKKK